MQTKSIAAAFAAEQETSAQFIRNQLLAARDSMREVTEAIERLNAQLGKRG